MIPRGGRLTGWSWGRHLPKANVHRKARTASVETFMAERLRQPGSFAAGKIGTTELMGLEYVYRWFQPPWPPAASWRRPAQRLHDCSGVYPVSRKVFYRWAEIYKEAVTSLDLVAQWQPQGHYLTFFEERLVEHLTPLASRAGLAYVHMLRPRVTWLDILPEFRWLVIHPFQKTILHQLPKLANLGVFSAHTIPLLEKRATDTILLPCPQFSYMMPPVHGDWCDTLEFLKQEMTKIDFDLALVAAGAWSLPLVAHAKTLGKKAMHLGGALQLLFGIKGARFDTWGVYNDTWIRPLAEDCPENFQKMENGAYW